MPSPSLRSAIALEGCAVRLDGSAWARWREQLRDNLVGNMLDQWKVSGYFWEQYDPDTGAGRRTHPFNGWSSLALLALAEIY